MRIYQSMIYDVLTHGFRKENRTGVDTVGVFNFNYMLSWDSSLVIGRRGDATVMLPDMVPLLTTKEINWKNIVVELLWFLSGSTNVEFLRRHGCKFWDPWADAVGNVPSAYGNIWRHFPVQGGGESDQIAWVIHELTHRPMNRRLVVSAWDPGNAQTSKLPPCHFAFVLSVQNNRFGQPRLCLHLTQRSCDLALGVPYNMASYGLLLLLLSHLTRIKPGIFAHTLLDMHVYTCKEDGSMAEFDHVPGLKSQQSRTPRKLPVVTIDPAIRSLADIETLTHPSVSTDDIMQAFSLTNYRPDPPIKFKVAV